MIRVDEYFMDMCQDCPALDAIIEQLDMSAPCGAVDHIITVKCDNRRLCENIMHGLRRIEESQKNKRGGTTQDEQE